MSGSLLQDFRRLPSRVRKVGKKARRPGAIGDTVIARNGKGHHRSNRRLTLNHHDPVGDAANRENRSLWRRDDRAKLIHLIHAEIADGERGVGNVGGPQLPYPRALGDIAPLHCDLCQARGMRVVNHCGNHSVINRDGDSHVHVIVQENSTGSPTRI